MNLVQDGDYGCSLTHACSDEVRKLRSELQDAERAIMMQCEHRDSAVVAEQRAVSELCWEQATVLELRASGIAESGLKEELDAACDQVREAEAEAQRWRQSVAQLRLAAQASEIEKQAAQAASEVARDCAIRWEWEEESEAEVAITACRQMEDVVRRLCVVEEQEEAYEEAQNQTVRSLRHDCENRQAQVEKLETDLYECESELSGLQQDLSAAQLGQGVVGDLRGAVQARLEAEAGKIQERIQAQFGEALASEASEAGRAEAEVTRLRSELQERKLTRTAGVQANRMAVPEMPSRLELERLRRQASHAAAAEQAEAAALGRVEMCESENADLQSRISAARSAVRSRAAAAEQAQEKSHRDTKDAVARAEATVEERCSRQWMEKMHALERVWQGRYQRLQEVTSAKKSETDESHKRVLSQLAGVRAGVSVVVQEVSALVRRYMSGSTILVGDVLMPLPAGSPDSGTEEIWGGCSPARFTAIICSQIREVVLLSAVRGLRVGTKSGQRSTLVRTLWHWFVASRKDRAEAAAPWTQPGQVASWPHCDPPTGLQQRDAAPHDRPVPAPARRPGNDGLRTALGIENVSTTMDALLRRSQSALHESFSSQPPRYRSDVSQTSDLHVSMVSNASSATATIADILSRQAQRQAAATRRGQEGAARAAPPRGLDSRPGPPTAAGVSAGRPPKPQHHSTPLLMSRLAESRGHQNPSARTVIDLASSFRE